MKKFLEKCFGRLSYVVTLTNVSSGQIQYHSFDSIKSVDKFVIEVNNESYWFVSGIEKKRVFDFTYKKCIYQKKLHFQNDYTEMVTVESVDRDNKPFVYDYSYLKIDKSLVNIKRV
jgi:hypothetical protein